jgi:hypothetical protein
MLGGKGSHKEVRFMLTPVAYLEAKGASRNIYSFPRSALIVIHISVRPLAELPMQ